MRWTAFAAAFLFAPPTLSAVPANCKVLDPELQKTYTGDCRNGLADGYGNATGIARYEGGFKAGRKHGRGVKTWPASGDRYDGEFVDDRKEGVGTYAWGARSASAGEKYSGTWRNDRRDGFGIYEWPDGDRYEGPWKNDVITGRPTPKMFARARTYGEIAAAVGRPGVKVCRELTVGIATKDWVRGIVTAVDGDSISVRIENAGLFEHVISNAPVRKGEIVHDALQHWTPC